MKLEVGMYVRSKISGLIGKIANIEELINEKGVLYYELEQKGSDYGFCSTEIDSVKASFDIMDLIEAGDYVNKEYIIQVSKTFGLLFIETTYYDEVSGEEKHKFIKKEEIKSIVTKEQFEQMSYKVGE